jgi:phage regulator Rha-like protein
MLQFATSKTNSMKLGQPNVEIVAVEELIRLARGQRVILDSDLARIYGVSTKRLNEAVKRNSDRFPLDFMFRLTTDEAELYRRSRSQIATLKRGQNIKYLPYAFNEHGAIMAANILNSRRAVQMSVFVVRAFVKMREVLAQNKELAAKLTELERKLTDRLKDHEKAIVHILDEIKKLMELPPEPEQKRQIGFLRD